MAEDLGFQNYLRKANGTELEEYISKEQRPGVHGDTIVTDHEGHPFKEIFVLNLNGRASANFPPVLHFGQVVEDVLLLPKALFEGLNRMKKITESKSKSTS